MSRKSNVRIVIEEALKHNPMVNVQNLCSMFFGYDRQKVTKILYEIKNR